MAKPKVDIAATVLAILNNKVKPEFILGDDGSPYVQYREGLKRLTQKITAKSFKIFLQKHLRANGLKLTKHQYEQVVDEFEALCHESKVVKNIFMRVGYDQNGNIIVDTNNTENEYVVISKDGWNVTQNCDVAFVTSPEQKALPSPIEIERKEFIVLLKKYFNLKNEDHFYLVLAFILKLYIRNTGSCVIFVFQGRQDSGKSTASETIKFLVDPTDPLLSLAPKTPEDIVISSIWAYMLAYDNLSGINPKLADFLCSIVYGVKHSKRILFTTDDRKAYNIKRDMLFNGIEELSSRPDLNDRITEVELVSIPPEMRKSKTLLNEELQRDRPYLLYGLYEILSEVMATLPFVPEKNLPRMADYAKIGIALEKVLDLEDGKFLAIYNDVIKEKKTGSFWNDQLCCLIYEKLLSSKGPLKGTSLELLKILFKRSEQNKYAPKTPRAFRAALDRAEPILKQEGIIVIHDRQSKRREVLITFNDDMWASLKMEDDKFDLNLKQLMGQKVDNPIDVSCFNDLL